MAADPCLFCKEPTADHNISGLCPECDPGAYSDPPFNSFAEEAPADYPERYSAPDCGDYDSLRDEIGLEMAGEF